MTGPEPSFAPVGLSPTYDFRLDGLCLRTRYSVVLEVEDAAGNTAAFADVAPGLPEHPGATYFRGTGWTDGYHVAYTVWTMGGTEQHVARYEVAINGADFDLREASLCLEDNSGPGPGAHTRAATDVWGDQVNVRVSLLVIERNAALGPGCVAEDHFRVGQWHADITATFTIEDFETGEVTIPFRAALSGGHISSPDFIDVTVIIRGRVTG